ncbi:unnamed protein product [Laminaria digitata]
MAKTLSVSSMELLEEADIPDEVRWKIDPFIFYCCIIYHSGGKWKYRWGVNMNTQRLLQFRPDGCILFCMYCKNSSTLALGYARAVVFSRTTPRETVPHLGQIIDSHWTM